MMRDLDRYTVINVNEPSRTMTGTIHQICIGENSKSTKGLLFVVMTSLTY